MVLPLLVIIGWMIDQPLTLDMGSYESMTIFLAVVTTTFVIKDGRSNWLMGITLLAAYAIISIGFWAHTNEELGSD